MHLDCFVHLPWQRAVGYAKSEYDFIDWNAKVISWFMDREDTRCGDGDGDNVKLKMEPKLMNRPSSQRVEPLLLANEPVFSLPRI